MRVGNAPQAFAALKNGLLTLSRTHGCTNIADALRYYMHQCKKRCTYSASSDFDVALGARPKSIL